MDTPWSLSSGAAVHERRIVLCVLASLALHALVLFLFPELRSGAPSPSAARMLIARFAQRAPEPPPALSAPKPRPSPPRAAPSPRPQVPQPAVSHPVSHPVSQPVSELPRSVLEAPAAPAATATFTMPASPPASMPVAPAAPAARIAAAPPARDGAQRQAGAGAEFDRGSVEQFRIALMGAARRYKRYPVQALERGWQGKVEIRLVIGPAGTLQSSVVKASSGHEILDNQALDMVKRAKPQTPVPAALQGREFSVDIPVIFDLQSG